MLPTARPSVEHRKLRDAARLHPLDGFGDRRVGADRPERPRAARLDQVADGLRHRLGAQELVFSHPVVVEELAHIIAAGVRADHHHDILSRETPGVRECCRDGRSGGAAHEQAFATSQLACGAEALGITDANPIVDDLAVEGLGHEVFADALDLPGFRRIARENGSLGIGADRP